jgi:deoxyribonuclease IV
MLIGAHESVAGGLHTAFARGEADGCEAMQLWTGYNTRWAPRVIDDEDASRFCSEAAHLGWPLLSHASYLINLASPDPALHRRSLEALLLELERCESLGIAGVVLHPGSHVGAGEAGGIRRVGRALAELHRRTPGFAVRVLLENTAGQGHTLGHAFAQLGRIIAATWHQPERLGVCIDTCHAFAAGYDLRDAAGYDAALAELAAALGGLERVQAFHLNDSRKGPGSRVDRHASIGEGQLGTAPFVRLVNDPRFAAVPAVVETPAEPDGSSSFARNIRTLKGLRV